MRFVVVVLLALSLVACGSESDGDVAGDNLAGDDAAGSPAPASPDAGSPDTGSSEVGEFSDAVLREFSSCAEVAAVFGDHLTGFEESGDHDDEHDDARQTCHWRQPGEPTGWARAIQFIGHYANQSDLHQRQWEAVGFERIEEPRVETFNGLVVLSELGNSTNVSVLGPRFEIRIQIMPLTDPTPEFVTVDQVIDIALDMIEQSD